MSSVNAPGSSRTIPFRKPCLIFCCGLVALSALTATQDPAPKETLAQLGARLGQESVEAYKASPFSEFSRDYFARITRDPEVKAAKHEVAIDSSWQVNDPPSPSVCATTMRGHFQDFLQRRMQITLRDGQGAGSRARASKQITLLESGGGVPDVAESYTLEITKDRVLVQGRDAAGLRDGIVRLVDLMGFRQGPVLPLGRWVIKPRLPVRLGAVPYLGSLREAVFLGYNAVFVPSGSLFEMSTSDALPELQSRRNPQLRTNLAAAVEEATRLGLKTYCWLETRQKFTKDHPVFQAHPEVRGTLTWKADGEYVLCTEHPLVKRYLAESVEGLLRAAPQLSGVVIIVGGEGFYHCYMRSFGAPKGHSACPRCDGLGGEQVVANLCNTLAAAIRKVNPQGELIAWPYSAEHVWSADKDQAGLIRLLKPGAGILTEVEKDEYVEKPDGFKKHLWDYSIDLIGPGDRAKRQIAACRAAGVPIYIKSEAELAFEAPRLPFIPCHDRWLERADAIARSGASGAWCFPAFKPMYGSSVGEVAKYAGWEPVEPAEKTLQQLAARIAGRSAAARLREAWKNVSEAIPFSPELPSYYTGPYYLGPGQPMCADPAAKLPAVFLGRYLFMAEMTDDEGMKLRPTYNTSPTGNVPIFGRMYRQMEARLGAAAAKVEEASPWVPQRLKPVFVSETDPIRWFYHTARTEANFYESCQIRDRVLKLAGAAARTPEEQSEAVRLLERWREILQDEKKNTEQARPVMARDMRLDYYYGGDHMFSHGVEVLDAKLKVLASELNEFLPSVATRCGITNQTRIIKTPSR
jgi:hypothetical protein